MSPVGRRLARLRDDLRTALAMPRVEVVASRGGALEEAMFAYLSRPHPRYRIVANKSFGAALLPLDEFDGVDEYLAPRRYVRRRARTASRRGYTTDLFDMDERRSDLLAIHRSLPERQGQPISASYLDPDAAYETDPAVQCLGVFHEDVVVAYSELRYVGDVVTMNRLMGHGDHLDAGVMCLLMAGVVEHVKAVRPDTRYVFYDTFFGASDGLRTFKTHLGFRPHYVRWKRELPVPAAGAGAR